MKLYLIRHGRQNSPLCNVDVPLSEEGRRQSLLLGERMKQIPLDAVYSSDLDRAAETAVTANKVWKCPHLIRPELREISFGDMEGMADERIAEVFEDFLREKAKMESDLAYPGGENSADVAARAFPVIEEIVSQDFSHVAVVTHGGVIRSLLCVFLGMDHARNRLFSTHLENCSITEIEYRRTDGRFFVNRFNDYAHLEPYPELLRGGWVRNA